MAGWFKLASEKREYVAGLSPTDRALFGGSFRVMAQINIHSALQCAYELKAYCKLWRWFIELEVEGGLA